MCVHVRGLAVKHQWLQPSPPTNAGIPKTRSNTSMQRTNSEFMISRACANANAQAQRAKTEIAHGKSRAQSPTTEACNIETSEAEVRATRCRKSCALCACRRVRAFWARRAAQRPRQTDQRRRVRPGHRRNFGVRRCGGSTTGRRNNRRNAAGAFSRRRRMSRCRSLHCHCERTRDADK